MQSGRFRLRAFFQTMLFQLGVRDTCHAVNGLFHKWLDTSP